MPPISAAQVMSVLSSEAASVTSPSLSPSPCRMRLNTGCLATAATRPLISPKTMIPRVENAKAEMSAKPNIEPACAAKTSWLMSTKPPTAVMIPRVSSIGFKLVLNPLEVACMRSQRCGRSVVGRAQDRSDLRGIGRPGLRQRLGARLQLVADAGAHRLRVGGGQMPLRRLLVDKCPLGGERPCLADILKVRLRALRTGGEHQKQEQQFTRHGRKTVPRTNRSA